MMVSTVVEKTWFAHVKPEGGSTNDPRALFPIHSFYSRYRLPENAKFERPAPQTVMSTPCLLRKPIFLDVYANSIFSSKSSTGAFLPPSDLRPRSPFLTFRSISASLLLLNLLARSILTSRLTWLGDTNSLFS